jgi:hypothetical protein
MNETLRHLDLAIATLRHTYPAHMMLLELERCRDTLIILNHIQPRTPSMFAEYAESTISFGTPV